MALDPYSIASSQLFNTHRADRRYSNFSQHETSVF